MVIKMTEDKSLLITIPTTIYRGERRADVLRFLIPSVYENINLADCALMMRYIRADGSGKSEALEYLPELYKGYLQYSTMVNTRLTAEDGDVIVWLTAYGDNDAVVLKTGELTLDILPSRDVADYMSDEDMDELEELNEKVRMLEATKADNIICNIEEDELQLTSNGELIGDPVDLGQITGGSSGDSSQDDGSDAVIHF